VARIARGVFLPDGDRGRDAVDLIDLGFLHALQELPSVSGEGLDVAPLALGVDGVESEGGFAGSGHTRDDRELVVGNGKRNVFQVVDPGTTDPDVILHWNLYYTIPARWNESGINHGKPC